MGSGTILTNPHGEASQVLSYMPIGEELLNVTDQTYSTPYRFTGHEKDEESGLHYAHARYLSTDLSIFLSVDPMYMKYPSLTPYHYCGNNPVMRVDPSGEDEYEFTSKGEIKNVKTTDFDSFHKVDKNGNRIEGKSLSFNKKVVSGNIKLKNNNGTAVNYLKVTGDDEAQ